jgi:BirA family biotin operon repressor/biotin-[acetyl-CoA-carboxylase] ligase
MRTIYLAQIDSTQNFAKLHYREFVPQEITCITADEQTAGRGRFQRKWISPPGVNLCATFYFRLPASQRDLATLAQVMAYTLASLLPLPCAIKWPNDVLLHGKKLAGILCETSFEQDEVHCFLGIGVNVNATEEDLATIDQPAISLFAATKKKWDRQRLLAELQEKWKDHLRLFQKEGFAPFYSPIDERLAGKGNPISGFDGKAHWKGICHSLEPDGRLKIYLPETGEFFLVSSLTY